MLFVIVMIAVGGVCLAVALLLALRESKNPKRRKAKLQQEQKDTAWSFLGMLHGPLGALGLGALKYVYKAWKTAPAGSAARLVWTMVIAAIAAVVLWAVLEIIDGIINREPRKDPGKLWGESSVDNQST